MTIAANRRLNGGGMAHSEGVVANSRETGKFTADGRSLTDMQQRFVTELVRNGGNGSKAAEYAGYSDPERAAWSLRNNSAVAAAIHRAQCEAITSGSSVAWGVMQELMTKAETPAQVRFQAAKWTLEAAGHGLAAQLGAAKLGGGGDKPISEMSVSELEEWVKRQQQAVDAIKTAEGRVVDVSSETDANIPIPD